MRRISAFLGLALMVAACAEGVTVATTASITSSTAPIVATTLSQQTTSPPTTLGDGFPVTVTDLNGSVLIERRPTSVVSLSPTATEMLFAVGAGDQVIAVDEFSTYPDDAPRTTLSGFAPNLEAILAFGPDLVVASFDPGDLVSGITAAGVPVLVLPSALSLDDTYSQIDALGIATGHSAEAADLVDGIRADLELIVESSAVPTGITYYYELDPTYFTASSSSFIGQLFSLLGMVNVADPADPDRLGFPQLSAEYLVTADPEVIFLADSSFGVTPEELSDRPGWEAMQATERGSVVVLDEDIASRWGPRVVDLLRTVSDTVAELFVKPAGE